MNLGEALLSSPVVCLRRRENSFSHSRGLGGLSLVVSLARRPKNSHSGSFCRAKLHFAKAKLLVSFATKLEA